MRRTSVLSGPSQGVLGIPRGCAEKRHVLQTPCVASQTLSQITGAQVYLKFENLQFTASFKERGACNRLQLLSSAQKAHQHAYALAEQQQLSFIHPFDDEAVATAGQITSAVVRERVDDLLLVDEGDIEQAVLMLLEIEKTLVEGAGAASAGDGGGAGVRLGDKKRAATAGPISISDRKLPEKQCESAVAALVIRALWSGTGGIDLPMVRLVSRVSSIDLLNGSLQPRRIFCHV